MISQIENLDRLKEHIRGSVLTPADSEYEQVRRPWNLTVDHHPALILVPENAQDVAAGVKFAHENGLGVAIQTTGHTVHQPADGALLIVTSHLTGVTVDAEARTARAEGGAHWEHVLEQAMPHGLAPLLGTSPHVGVAGYTLVGGISWMARKFGYAADSLIAVEIVTADGQIRRASADENADLFWALHGGSGNFGVVTALEFKLYPVATIYAGGLVYPGEMARDALRFFRDWTQTLPEAMTSSLAVLKFPDLPFVPEGIRGKTQLFLRAVYVGEEAEGAPYIQRWLDWKAPLQNSFRTMPFAEIGTVSNDPVDPSPTYSSNEMFRTLSDEAIDAIIRHGTAADAPIVFNELRHIGGAMQRIPAGGSAAGNRDAHYSFTIGAPIFSPDRKAPLVEYMGRYKAALQPFVSGGGYLNFMSGSEAEKRASGSFTPESYQRLLDIKAKYDPDNLFRHSFPLAAAERV
jgi:FAD/FMN-containing dehydrogenase